MKMNTRELSFIALFAVIIVICSMISIPSAVPFTLQTFAVFLALMLLGARKAFYTILCYILMGAIGLPVFAGGKGGVAVLLGNTGGYIVGFLIMACIYAIFEKNTKLHIPAMILGLIALYAFGTAWFMIVYTSAKGSVALTTVLGWTVIPFIIPDLVKLALAYVLARRLKPVLSRMLLK